MFWCLFVITTSDVILEWVDSLGLSELCLLYETQPVTYHQPPLRSRSFAGVKKPVIYFKLLESDLHFHRKIYWKGDLVRVYCYGNCYSIVKLRISDPGFFDELYSLLWGLRSLHDVVTCEKCRSLGRVS